MNLEQLRRDWVSVPGKGELQARIWDERASDYVKRPIPDRENDLFLRDLWDRVSPGKEMEVLDIGCGAGLYTIALADHVKRAVGTDVSPRMIEGARQRGWQMGLGNVEFRVLDWSEERAAAPSPGRFDIVIAHMTPAVNDCRTLERMNQCSKGHCFLVKPARRRDEIQDAAFALAGITSQKNQMDEAVANVFAWLWLSGYRPEISYREEIWQDERPVEQMAGWCIGRARLHREITPFEEEKIRVFLDRKSVDGKVTETVRTTIVTVYWKQDADK